MKISNALLQGFPNAQNKTVSFAKMNLIVHSKNFLFQLKNIQKSQKADSPKKSAFNLDFSKTVSIEKETSIDLSNIHSSSKHLNLNVSNVKKNNKGPNSSKGSGKMIARQSFIQQLRSVSADYNHQIKPVNDAGLINKRNSKIVNKTINNSSLNHFYPSLIQNKKFNSLNNSSKFDELKQFQINHLITKRSANETNTLDLQSKEKYLNENFLITSAMEMELKTPFHVLAAISQAHGNIIPLHFFDHYDLTRISPIVENNLFLSALLDKKIKQKNGLLSSADIDDKTKILTDFVSSLKNQQQLNHLLQQVVSPRTDSLIPKHDGFAFKNAKNKNFNYFLNQLKKLNDDNELGFTGEQLENELSQYFYRIGESKLYDIGTLSHSLSSIILRCSAYNHLPNDDKNKNIINLKNELIRLDTAWKANNRTFPMLPSKMAALHLVQSENKEFAKEGWERVLWNNTIRQKIDDLVKDETYQNAIGRSTCSLPLINLNEDDELRLQSFLNFQAANPDQEDICFSDASEGSRMQRVSNFNEQINIIRKQFLNENLIADDRTENRINAAYQYLLERLLAATETHIPLTEKEIAVKTFRKFSPELTIDEINFKLKFYSWRPDISTSRITTLADELISRAKENRGLDKGNIFSGIFDNDTDKYKQAKSQIAQKLMYPKCGPLLDNPRKEFNQILVDQINTLRPWIIAKAKENLRNNANKAFGKGDIHLEINKIIQHLSSNRINDAATLDIAAIVRSFIPFVGSTEMIIEGIKDDNPLEFINGVMFFGLDSTIFIGSPIRNFLTADELLSEAASRSEMMQPIQERLQIQTLLHLSQNYNLETSIIEDRLNNAAIDHNLYSLTETANENLVPAEYQVLAVQAKVAGNNEIVKWKSFRLVYLENEKRVIPISSTLIENQFNEIDWLTESIMQNRPIYFNSAEQKFYSRRLSLIPERVANAAEGINDFEEKVRLLNLTDNELVNDVVDIFSKAPILVNEAKAITRSSFIFNFNSSNEELKTYRNTLANLLQQASNKSAVFRQLLHAHFSNPESKLITIQLSEQIETPRAYPEDHLLGTSVNEEYENLRNEARTKVHQEIISEQLSLSDEEIELRVVNKAKILRNNYLQHMIDMPLPAKIEKINIITYMGAKPASVELTFFHELTHLLTGLPDFLGPSAGQVDIIADQILFEMGNWHLPRVVYDNKLAMFSVNDMATINQEGLLSSAINTEGKNRMIDAIAFNQEIKEPIENAYVLGCPITKRLTIVQNEHYLMIRNLRSINPLTDSLNKILHNQMAKVFKDNVLKNLIIDQDLDDSIKQTYETSFKSLIKSNPDIEQDIKTWIGPPGTNKNWNFVVKKVNSDALPLIEPITIDSTQHQIVINHSENWRYLSSKGLKQADINRLVALALEKLFVQPFENELLRASASENLLGEIHNRGIVVHRANLALKSMSPKRYVAQISHKLALKDSDAEKELIAFSTPIRRAAELENIYLDRPLGVQTSSSLSINSVRKRRSIFQQDEMLKAAQKHALHNQRFTVHEIGNVFNEKVVKAFKLLDNLEIKLLYPHSPQQPNDDIAERYRRAFKEIGIRSFVNAYNGLAWASVQTFKQPWHIVIEKAPNIISNDFNHIQLDFAQKKLNVFHDDKLRYLNKEGSDTVSVEHMVALAYTNLFLSAFDNYFASDKQVDVNQRSLITIKVNQIMAEYNTQGKIWLHQITHELFRYGEFKKEARLRNITHDNRAEEKLEDSILLAKALSKINFSMGLNVI